MEVLELLNESLERFILFLAEDKERQDKVKAFAGDMDALSAYAKEFGFYLSPETLWEYREQSLELLESRMKQARQVRASQRPGVRDFYALLALAETDEEAARRLCSLTEGTLPELIAYGKEKGFIFDEQDLEAVGKDILEPSDELSEEELEIISGGTTVVAYLFVGFVLVGLGVVAFLGAVFMAVGRGIK